MYCFINFSSGALDRLGTLNLGIFHTYLLDLQEEKK